MDNLQYKGIRSTRFILAVLIIILSSVFLVLNTISQDNWVDIIKWTFATYATSEAAAKGAEAYKKKESASSKHDHPKSAIEG